MTDLPLTSPSDTILDEFSIENLSRHQGVIPKLAAWHFAQWGTLTGTTSQESYQQFLVKSASPVPIPTTWVAVRHGRCLGSVNLVDCDMQIRPALHPWLAHLFVDPVERSKGVGTSLVEAAVAKSKDMGHPKLYLYTSGTLSLFYESLGWIVREKVLYKGKERIVMEKSVFVRSPRK